MSEMGMTSHKAVRVLVSGRVQGVWFRVHTQRKAQQLGVGGWVRNLSDGTVEFMAEGDAGNVDRLVAWAWEGSPMAEVTDVESEDVPGEGCSTFSVRY